MPFHLGQSEHTQQISVAGPVNIFCFISYVLWELVLYGIRCFCVLARVAQLQKIVN